MLVLLFFVGSGLIFAAWLLDLSHWSASLDGDRVSRQEIVDELSLLVFLLDLHISGDALVDGEALSGVESPDDLGEGDVVFEGTDPCKKTLLSKLLVSEEIQLGQCHVGFECVGDGLGTDRSDLVLLEHESGQCVVL